MAYKAALVDFDGTLADSMPYWLQLPRLTLEKAGIPEPEDLQALIRTIPFWEVAVRLAERYPQLAAERPLEEQWCERMEENFRRHIRRKAGAAELLELLARAGLRVVILSATKQPLLEHALEALGLRPLVNEVFSEEEAGSKRTEAPYRFCTRRLGAELKELLLVEDAPRNLAAGAALGLGTIGVYDASMAAYQEQVRQTADVYLPDYLDLSPVGSFLR